MADTKFTFSLTADGSRSLEELAVETSKSKAELIREAIALRKYLHDQIKLGATFFMEDAAKSRPALKFVGW